MFKLLKKLLLNLVSPYDTMIKELGSKRKMPLSLLIQRCEDRMRLKPECPFCRTKMMFRRSTIVLSVPTRDDQGWKCPHCFHTSHFGVPLTRKAYSEEFKLRGGTMLLIPSFRYDERTSLHVIQRLKALGYLD